MQGAMNNFVLNKTYTTLDRINLYFLRHTIHVVTMGLTLQ